MSSSLENLKNIISSDQMPLEDKFEAILQLSMNKDPEYRDYLDSLLKHKNVRIRYFIKKIIHKEIGWKEKLLSKGKENLSSALLVNEKKSGFISFNLHEICDEPIEEETEKEEKIPFSILLISATVTGVLLVFFISSFYSFIYSKKEKLQTKTEELISSGELGFDKMLEKASECILSGKEKEGFTLYFKLYTLYSNKMTPEQDKKNVGFLSRLSIDFLKNYISKIKKLNISFFRTSLEIISNVKILGICSYAEDGTRIKKLVKLMLSNPLPFFYLNPDLIKKIWAKTFDMKNNRNRHLIYFMVALYQHRSYEAENIIKFSLFGKKYKKALKKILYQYNSLNEKILLTKSVVFISKPVFSKDYINSIEQNGFSKNIVDYFKAFLYNPLVTQFFNRKVLKKLTYRYISDYKKKNSDERTSIFVAFAYAIYDKKEKAIEILGKKWESPEISLLASGLNGILESNIHYFPITDILPENMVLTELHSFLFRKRNTGKNNMIEKLESQSNVKDFDKDKRFLEVRKLLKNNKYSEGIIELKKIAHEIPFEAAPYLGIGDIYMNMGNNAAAFEAYEEALKRQPDINELRHALAEDYKKNGNVKKSKFHYGLLLVHSKSRKMKNLCTKKIMELGNLKRNN